jgi:hypothetical protein
LHVNADVVGGEGDGAVSVESGHGEVAVRVGVGDGPAFSVADGFAGGGAESSVVAAGGDDVADQWRRSCIRHIMSMPEFLRARVHYQPM